MVTKQKLALLENGDLERQKKFFWILKFVAIEPIEFIRKGGWCNSLKGHRPQVLTVSVSIQFLVTGDHVHNQAHRS